MKAFFREIFLTDEPKSHDRIEYSKQSRFFNLPSGIDTDLVPALQLNSDATKYCGTIRFVRNDLTVLIACPVASTASARAERSVYVTLGIRETLAM